MNRRALLKLAPMVPVAAALGVPAVAAEETPVMRAYREWKAASDDLRDPKWDSRSVEDQDNACAALVGAQERILNIPARNQRDFILKVMAHTSFGEHGLPDEDQNPSLWAEARALVA